MKSNTKEALIALGASILTGDISRLLNDINCYAKTGTVHTDPAVEEKLKREYTKAGVYQSLWKLTKRETESDRVFKDLKERLEGRNPDGLYLAEQEVADYDPLQKCIVLGNKLEYQKSK